MNNKNKKIKLLLSFFIFSICGLLFSCNSAFAGTKETVLEKSVLQGLYRCYTTGAINKDAGALSAFHKFETLIIGGDSDGKYIALPAGLTGINDNNISCKGLFMGDSVGLFTESGSFDGLFKMFGKSEYTENITSDTKKTTLLKGMGYSAGSTSSTKNCVYYVYTNDDPSGDGESYTDKVCLSNGELSVETNNRDCGNNSGICMAPIGFQANGKTLTIRDFLWTKEEKVTYSGSWDKFRSDLNTTMSSDFYSPEGGDAFTYRFSSEKSDNTQSTDGDVTYTFSDGKSAAVTAIKFLNPSYALYGSLAFTDQEKLWYYENTITNWFYKNKSLDDYYKCGISENPSLNSQYIIINVNPSTGAKNTAGDCGVNKENTTNSDGIHGFDRSNHFSANGTVGAMDLASVVAIINSLVDGMDESELPTDGTIDSQEDGEVEATCMNTAGTSLGWILCPVLDAFGGATKWAYEKLVEPALEIEPQLFTGKGDGTRTAWETFRNIANIFFIILFLVVIFSQLTGVGIDNYGIKKILPKLIVAAILINLSYVICLIFVDLSNIFGNGLRSIFTGLGSQLKIPSSIEGIDIDVAGGLLTAVGIIIALVGSVAVAITASGGLVAFLVSLLVVALSAIIALFFLFLLLAAREAAIVVLTVLSPLAFACCILPNTQNIFRKWYQLGWRLLLVYPIAGLLIGGGDYVSRLLLVTGEGSEGFFSAFTAMIAGIVPIFFIPTVLKQSFALMGGLGAKLAGLGRSVSSRMSGDLDKSIRGSERFKNYQDRRNTRRQVREAGRVEGRINRARRIRGALGMNADMTRRERERLGTANRTILMEEARQNELSDMTDTSYLAAQRTKAQNARTERMAEATAGIIPIDQSLAQRRAMSQRRSQEFKNYTDQYSVLTRNAMDTELQSAVAAYRANRNEQNTIRLQAAISAADGRGMNSELLGALGQNGTNKLDLKGDDSNDQAVLNQLAGSGNKVLSQYAKARAKNSTSSMSLYDFVNGTNTGDNLADVFNSKGPEIMNGMDDDTLSYINNAGGSARIDPNTILNAATQTSDAKELAQLNSMLRNRTGFSIKTNDFAKIQLSTLQNLDPSVYAAALTELQNGSESSRQIISKMDQRVRTQLGL